MQVHTGDERLLRKDGTCVWVRITVSSVLNEQGAAHYYLAALLVGIIGNISLAMDSVPESSSIGSALTDELRASDRAASLTKQLLAYSGRGQFLVRKLDISELVRENLSILRTAVPRTLELNFRLSDLLPAVEADATQVQQILMNLVINAADAVPNGHGRITVETGETRLDANALRNALSAPEAHPGRYVRMAVSDNGIGMEPDVKARIFDPFFSTKPSGRGLGLSAVLGVVNGHRGALRLESTKGAGTTFEVFLPAAEGASGRTNEPQEGANVRGTGTILVVDDEDIVRRTASSCLQRLGYNVIEAENGERALAILSNMKEPPAAVLLDVTMPVMDGPETLRRIREKNPKLRIVLTTGFDRDDAMSRFEDISPDAFIQKPYTIDQLGRKLRELNPIAG